MDVIDNQTNNPSLGLKINQIAKAHLRETAKWANFLAIVGFVMIGFIVIGALFVATMMTSLGALGDANPMGAMMGAAPGIMITVLYLLIALVYFFPTLYIYKFAKHAKVALGTDDTNELQVALQNQKSAYKFMGIFMIVTLSLYALLFIIAIVGGGLAAMMQ